MTFLIVLFALALICLAGLIGRKVYKIRKGQVRHEDQKHAGEMIVSIVVPLGRDALKVLKQSGHQIVLGTLKAFVIITHKGSKLWESYAMPIILRVQKHTPKIGHTGIRSAVTEYRKKVKHFRHKIERDGML